MTIVDGLLTAREGRFHPEAIHKSLDLLSFRAKPVEKSAVFPEAGKVSLRSVAFSTAINRAWR